MTAPADPWETRSRTAVVVSFRTATHRHTYTVLNRLNPDDLMINMAKAEAHLINSGEDITYFPPKEVRDYLVASNTLVG